MHKKISTKRTAFDWAAGLVTVAKTSIIQIPIVEAASFSCLMKELNSGILRESNLPNVTAHANQLESDQNAAILYKNAWAAYLKRTGQSEDEIKNLIEQTRRILEDQ